VRKNKNRRMVWIVFDNGVAMVGQTCALPGGPKIPGAPKNQSPLHIYSLYLKIKQTNPIIKICPGAPWLLLATPLVFSHIGRGLISKFFYFFLRQRLICRSAGILVYIIRFYSLFDILTKNCGEGYKGEERGQKLKIAVKIE